MAKCGTYEIQFSCEIQYLQSQANDRFALKLSGQYSLLSICFIHVNLISFVILKCLPLVCFVDDRGGKYPYQYYISSIKFL